MALARKGETCQKGFIRKASGRLRVLSHPGNATGGACLDLRSTACGLEYANRMSVLEAASGMRSTLETSNARM